MSRKLLLLFLICHTHFLPGQNVQKESQTHYVVSKIEFQGNRKTKAFVLQREILFNVGDSISESELNSLLTKSRENLLNLSLFNFLTIDYTLKDKMLSLKVQVVERWYLWPQMILDIPGQNLNTWLRTTDFSRINYGIWLSKENFRGRNELLKISFGLGFDEQLGISYAIPFINPKLTTGMSFEALYFQNHQMMVQLQENKRQYIKTYNQVLRKTSMIGVGWQFRKNIYNTHYIKLSYQTDQFADTLSAINPEFTGNKMNSNHYFTLYYKFKNDLRDNKSYPLRGHYFDLEFQQNGFGITNDNIDYGFVHSSYRRFLHLFDGFYYQFSGKGLYNMGSRQPFYLKHSVGTEADELSGYEYYLIPCNFSLSLRSNIKITILKPHVFQFGFIPWEKFSKIHYAFYFNVFSNYSYIYNKTTDLSNPLNNSWLFASGAGIDFVTYYDKVFRFEVSLNRKNEMGFFIHLNSPL
ncbi:MAG: POTRA domain-containing protein [Bacteroidota bacterium]